MKNYENNNYDLDRNCDELVANDASYNDDEIEVVTDQVDTRREAVRKGFDGWYPGIQVG